MADESKSSTNWGALILGGCGCFVFAIGVLIVVGYFGFKAAVDAPRTAVDEFLAAAGEGDVETAHDYFANALKEVQPIEDFRAVVEQNPHLFVVVDSTFTEQSRDMAKATFRGTVTLENGSELPAEFVLIEEEGAWKLISYQIGSSE
jgi:hypothetical protein